MGDLFSTFNPNTEIFGLTFTLNWFAAMSCLLFIPQKYWILPSKGINLLLTVITLLIEELSAVFGIFMAPGAMLFFISLFMFIIFSNFLGLIPYVFTASSHLSYTLSLGLPLWLGYMIISLVNQFDQNMAHLVPEGTPAGLMPLMVIIESVSLIIRPFTLAVRLAANMVAGHLLLVLLGSQGADLSSGPLLILMVALTLLLTLECAVACIQSYVFMILSSLYLAEHNSPKLSQMGV